MSNINQFTLETNYRNPALQQGPGLTLPGALAALKDMHEVVQNAYIDFDDQARRPPELATEGARRVKRGREEAAAIVEATKHYPARPTSETALVLNAINTLDRLVGDLYRVARERALIRMVEEAGI